MNLALFFSLPRMRFSNSGPFFATNCAVLSTIARTSGGGWITPTARVCVSSATGVAPSTFTPRLSRLCDRTRARGGSGASSGGQRACAGESEEGGGRDRGRRAGSRAARAERIEEKRRSRRGSGRGTHLIPHHRGGHVHRGGHLSIFAREQPSRPNALRSHAKSTPVPRRRRAGRARGEGGCSRVERARRNRCATF